MDITLNSNSSLVSNDQEEIDFSIAPEDKYNYSYWSFMMLGIVLILPWNALIQSLGYFDGKYPDKDFNFLISTLANAPIFLSQILILFVYRFIDMKKFIIISLVIMILLSVGIPLISNYWKEYIAIMSILSLFCFFNGILQSISFSYAGSFPPRIISALTNGCGLSGVVIGGCRAISLAVFPTKNGDPNDSNLFNGAILYFSSTSFFCLVCLIMYMTMIRTKYNIHFMQIHNWNTERPSMNSFYSDNKISRNTIDTDMYKLYVEHLANKSPSIATIHGKIWKSIWGVIINFLSTFLVFPGVVLEAGLGWIDDDDWRSWTIIIIFTSVDTLGRIVSGRFMKLGQNSALLVNNIIIAFSCGFVANCQMIIGCTQPEPYERNVSSKIMNFCLVLGIFLGSVISTFCISRLF